MINILLSQFASEAAEKEGIAVLGIDPKVILLQGGVFLLLFFVIKKFALTNIVNTLEERRKTIDSGVELGVSMKKKHAEFEEEIKKLHVNARDEVDAIIANANKESDSIIKAAEASATKKVESMMKDAEGRISREMDKARQNLRGEMLELVSEATEILISERVDAKKDASLIERALSKVRA